MFVYATPVDLISGALHVQIKLWRDKFFHPVINNTVRAG